MEAALANFLGFLRATRSGLMSRRFGAQGLGKGNCFFEPRDGTTFEVTSLDTTNACERTDTASRGLTAGNFPSDRCSRVALVHVRPYMTMYVYMTMSITGKRSPYAELQAASRKAALPGTRERRPSPPGSFPSHC